MTNFDLIFDNAGGVTLQTADYCHHFNGREKELAQILSDIFDGANPGDWEGNEPEYRMEYDAEVERNGGYKWMTYEEVADVVGRMTEEEREDWLEGVNGLTQKEVFQELFKLRDNAYAQQ